MANPKGKLDKTEAPSGSNFELDGDDITAEYHSERHIYQALKEEIVFILKDRIESEGIKIHMIESRVKELDSLLDKCIRKNCNKPFSEFTDITAARVVCLFRSDLERLKNLVHDNFEVVSIDDKSAEGNDPLRYLSIHMACKIKSGYSGPRYEKILNKVFEIQLRTLCMHCWAAVSHYVDYKGDWDVPGNLKMALNALSGLFYVADSEFEQFNAARIESKKSAERSSSEDGHASEVNLDTVTALLDQLYPDRDNGPPGAISELVKELKAAGYTSIDKIKEDLAMGGRHLKEYEEGLEGEGLYFSNVGAARITLDGVSPAFKKIRNAGEKTKRAS